MPPSFGCQKVFHISEYFFFISEYFICTFLLVGFECDCLLAFHLHKVCSLMAVLLNIIFLIEVDDVKIVSGSYDRTLKLWDIKTGRCKTSFRY